MFHSPLRGVRRLCALLAPILVLAAAPAIASAATVTESPSPAYAGAPATVSWTGGTADMWDWIGFFPAGATSSSQRISWVYADTCTQTLGGAPPASGSCSYSLPATIAPGNYEFRYYTTSARLQGSTPVTVTNTHQYVGGAQLYNPGSWVNTPLPASAPIDPNNATMVSNFLSQVDVDANGNPAANTTGKRWLSPIAMYATTNTDPSTWSTVCSTEVLAGTSWPWMDDLHNAWMTTKVPVPASLPFYDGGSDDASTIYDAATGQMWDFFHGPNAAPAGTVDGQGRTCNYEAEGGDYEANVPASPGYFSNQTLADGIHEDNLWGRRASALPSAAGAITEPEWNNPLEGIDHTLELIVGCANPATAYWPATRHDGCAAGDGGIPEGARVRLDPTVTCPHGTAGPTGPTQLAFDRAYELCVTLQQYGAVVTDETGSGSQFMYANTYIDGVQQPLTADGGNDSGRQWPNWYWDEGITHLLPHLQVIDPSYRPPYAPAQ